LPGVVSYLMRQVALSNENACNISCRFHIEGPFKIRLVEQVGRAPIRPVSPVPGTKTKRKAPAPETQDMQGPPWQVFVVAKRETITLQLEFVPKMVPKDQWTEHSEHKFTGELVVEYPRDADDTVNLSQKGHGQFSLSRATTPSGRRPDLQRVHLVAISRRPAVRVTVIPFPGLDRPALPPRADEPPWAEMPPAIIEFGEMHVESSTRRERFFLLSNTTNVTATWALLHVGRKRRPPNDIGDTCREVEDYRALDDKDAFEFGLSEGELWGPSKDLKAYGSNERAPHYYPKVQPKVLPHHDAERYEPAKVKITFRPKKNELYKCRFRIQIDAGRSVDIICRGCGSYDEHDDIMELREA